MRIPINLANSVRYKARQLPFSTACIVAGLAVYPLSIALAAPVITVLAVIRKTFFAPESHFMNSIEFAIVVGVAAASVGLAIGLLQKQIVGSHFGVDLRRWRLISALGACVAIAVIVYIVENRVILLAAMRSPLGDSYYDYYQFMLSLIFTPMIQFALVLSAIQTLSLYRYVRSAWLWLAANVVAGALFFWIVIYIFGSTSFMSWLVAPIAQSALVGYAMRYLVTQRRRGGKAKREETSIS